MQSFTKGKRPELFKVKDEHKNPCSYLASNFTYLDKNCVSSCSNLIFCRMLKIKHFVISNVSLSSNHQDLLPTWQMRTQEKFSQEKNDHSPARKASSTTLSSANKNAKPYSPANSRITTTNSSTTCPVPTANQVQVQQTSTYASKKRNITLLAQKDPFHCRGDTSVSQSKGTSTFQRQQSTTLRRPNILFKMLICIEITNNLHKPEESLTLSSSTEEEKNSYKKD